ncbi:MAG TPA: hypothetical protein VH619_03330 [Verrucomicrobiae bacterium]|jgi:IS1 family transposase|nr:hypothetical protein [Verrucomicrobiae bacterium]
MANNLSSEQKNTAISMLCECASIRAIERITGIHRDTIMRLGVRVGQACEKICDEKMRNLECKRIEVDEIWGFIGKKNKHLTAADSTKERGDIWTFIALDADTKLIPTWQVGARDGYHTQMFINDLSNRLKDRTQITSDGLQTYVEAVKGAFGDDVDFGQLVKTYSVTNLGNFKEAASRYSPAEVVRCKKSTVIGSPKWSRITTSHVEKQNHTLRMHCRRLSRLTNAFSKKLENFKAAVALNFAYYNFYKTHITVQMTPAQAAGVESERWTVLELVERCGE